MRKRSHGLATWKDMLKNASRDIVNWQTNGQNNCTKVQLPAWMITISRKRNLNRLENYQKSAHKLCG